MASEIFRGDTGMEPSEALKNKKFSELAKEFVRKHNRNYRWSSFDRFEIISIELFAQWLDKRIKK